MKINSAFILRKIYGKNILIPIKSNSTGNDPILLNDVAASIWEESTKGLTEDEIVTNLLNLYNLEVDSPEALSITMFIEQLINMRLLIK